MALRQRETNKGKGVKKIAISKCNMFKIYIRGHSLTTLTKRGRQVSIENVINMKNVSYNGREILSPMSKGGR